MRTFWRPRLAALRAPTVEAGRPLALAEEEGVMVPVAVVYALKSLTCIIEILRWGAVNNCV